MATKNVKKFRTVKTLLTKVSGNTISLGDVKGNRMLCKEGGFFNFDIPDKERDKLLTIFAKALKVNKDKVKETPNRGVFNYLYTDGKNVYMAYDAKIYINIEDCPLTKQIKVFINGK